MKSAKDLMTPNPKGIQSGEELRDVVKIFFENSISSAPVVTPMGDVMGILTEISLIKAFLRHHLEPGKHEKIVHHKELLDEATFIQEDTSLSDLVKSMLKAPSHRVLILNNRSNLVGIVSPKDILSFLVGEDKKTIDLKAQLNSTKDKIAKLKTKIKDIKDVLDQYKHLYENAPNMMHSVNKDGKIIMANKKIHEMLGYDDGELLEKTIFDIYDPNCHHEASHGLKKIMDDGFHHATYTTMLKKDGSRIRVDIASTSLKDPAGKFIGTISAARVVDSEVLLRALHGVMEGSEVDNASLKILVDEAEAEIDDKKKKTGS